MCPRLVQFRNGAREKFPDWHNGPVPNWSAPAPNLMIVGLAPGLRGANRTGRPFTGDWAGDLLYQTLVKFGFAQGEYGQSSDDGLKLVDAIIVNAVRCVPPENKPIGAEISNCRPFLEATIEQNSSVQIVVALGGIAHNSFLTVFGVKKKDHPFGHGNEHRLPNGSLLIDSYHCSRYNTNTKVLTEEMFEDIFARARQIIDG
ncbi:uracil-DNA glycosylase [Maritalea sp.]|uniref:uracil-DNA glycosylase n=1 Tax=Maritalea sp. TaxID=2003361 RepID=UPI003EF8DCAE